MRLKIHAATVVTNSLVSSVALSNTALADVRWENNRPHLDQVNDLLANQNKRIYNEVKEGGLAK